MTKFTRPAAAAAKKTVVRAKPVERTTRVEMPEPEVVISDDAEVHSAWQQVQAAIDNMLGKINRPSWVRELANITCGLIAYASTFYCCMALIDVVVMAAISYVGVGFISFLVAFFSMFLAFMLAFKVGKIAYSAAAAFDYDRVKSRVTGFFRFGKPAHAA